jgi:hypothetical protein
MLDKSSLSTIELYDLTGMSIWKKVHQCQGGMNTLSLDLSSLPSGYYFLKLSQDSQLKEVRRVIVL